MEASTSFLTNVVDGLEIFRKHSGASRSQQTAFRSSGTALASGDRLLRYRNWLCARRSCPVALSLWRPLFPVCPHTRGAVTCCILPVGSIRNRNRLEALRGRKSYGDTRDRSEGVSDHRRSASA